MTNLQFSDDDKFLAAINDKGTLHIFNLDSKLQQNQLQRQNDGIFSAVSSLATKYVINE